MAASASYLPSYTCCLVQSLLCPPYTVVAPSRPARWCWAWRRQQHIHPPAGPGGKDHAAGVCCFRRCRFRHNWRSRTCRCELLTELCTVPVPFFRDNITEAAELCGPGNRASSYHVCLASSCMQASSGLPWSALGSTHHKLQHLQTCGVGSLAQHCGTSCCPVLAGDLVTT